MTTDNNTNIDISKRIRRLLALVIFLVVFAATACFEHARDWNTATRFLLTHAIVDHGQIEVTRYVASGGKLHEHPPTRDLAFSPQGRFFCDKAPGQSILGVPAYWLASRLRDNPATNDGRPEPTDYWTTLFSSGLVTAATATCLFLALVRLRVRPFAATAGALTCAFATFAQPYGSLYYSHAATALCLLIATSCLLIDFDSIAHNLLAGFFAGLAVTFEYPAALFPAIVLAVHLARRIGRVRGPGALAPLMFLLGAIPPAAALACYHAYVTGSPFKVPYTLEMHPDFAYHRQGIGIPISTPDPASLVALLIGPTRGLLWYASITIFAIPGLYLLTRRGKTPIAAVVTLTSLAFLFAIAGFPTWHGGLATGPRLLLPVLPLLMIPATLWLDATARFKLARYSWAAIAILSFIWITAINAAGARIPHYLQNVTREYIAPNLQAAQPGNSHIGQSLTGTTSGFLPLVATLLVLSILAAVPLILAHRAQALAKSRRS